MKYFIFIVTAFVVLMAGCGNNEYDEFVKEYDKTYFELTKSLDIEDTMKTLENLQEEKNIKLIDELEDLLDGISDKVPNNSEKHFKMLHSRYKSLILIKESYTKWDKMSPDEKGKVLAEIGYINMRKTDKMQESNK